MAATRSARHPKRGRRIAIAAALAVGVAAAALFVAARTWPPINDITTNLDDPPPFVALVPLRTEAGASSAYPGADTARAQQAGYPDLRPLTVATAPDGAFAAALAVARTMGWTIVADDAASGRIEAVATTRLLRFHDDIVIRIRPTASGSTVDVRSASRVGRGDLGANARRIREFASRLAAR